MKAPDRLSAAEQAALDKMGSDTWQHIGNGYYTRNGKKLYETRDEYLRSQMIAALWRSGYVELLPGKRARRQEVPGLPEGVLRC